MTDHPRAETQAELIARIEKALKSKAHYIVVERTFLCACRDALASSAEDYKDLLVGKHPEARSLYARIERYETELAAAHAREQRVRKLTSEYFNDANTGEGSMVGMLMRSIALQLQAALTDAQEAGTKV